MSAVATIWKRSFDIHFPVALFKKPTISENANLKKVYDKNASNINGLQQQG